MRSACFEPANHFQHLGRRQAKLCRFAARLFPTAGTLRVKLDAHPEDRNAAALFLALEDIQHVIELIEFFDHDHYALAAACPGKRQLDKLFVLETVEHQQTVRRLFQRQRRVKLGFRTSFETKIVTRALAQILLHQRPLLIDLHRVDAHVRALIFKFLDGTAEGALQFADLGRDELGKTEQHRRANAATGQIVDNLFQIG